MRPIKEDSTHKTYKDLKKLIRETDRAWKDFIAQGGRFNGDFAKFAAQWLDEYRRVLRQPSLSEHDLASLIRSARRRSYFFNRFALGRARHIARQMIRRAA